MSNNLIIWHELTLWLQDEYDCIGFWCLNMDKSMDGDGWDDLLYYYYYYPVFSDY